jgi:phytoene desaturase
MKSYKISIIGAGPGGLSVAMILSHRGYNVTVFEKENEVGGRNRAIHNGPYTFNTGPTFLMMTFILKEIFELSGKHMEEYLSPIGLEPMYNLSFNDLTIQHTTDKTKMRKEIQTHFAKNETSLDKFFAREKVRYKAMYPCLQKSYSSALDMISLPLLRALPHLSLTKSLYHVLDDYFDGEKLILSFSFQSKYLGMSPWRCPGAFGLIPYVEHQFGIDYLQGGLCAISKAMAEVAQQNGTEIRLSTPVRRVVVKDGKTTGLILDNDTFIESDAVVIGADFGFAMETLFDPGVIKKWSPANLRKKTYSCSTFMLYLGLDKVYNEPHHKIIFANDYRGEIEKIDKDRPPTDDFSIYLNNASVIDLTLAPKGHSALYVLVPVSNQKSGMQWTKEECISFRNKVLQQIKKRTSMTDIDQHIKTESMISPRDWEHDHSLFIGATFNLGHSLDQMLYFRPHNRFEEVKRCYLTGGGTHPGSGLPTIFESGRISANLISKDLKLSRDY